MKKKRPMKIVRTPVMIDFFHSVLCAYHAYTIDNLILLNLISLSLIRSERFKRERKKKNNNTKMGGKSN